MRLSFDVRAGLVMRQIPPLGHADVRRHDRAAPLPHLLHRCLPTPPRDQLARRGHAARARHLQRLRGLLAARRSALRDGAAHRLLDRPGGARDRHLDRQPALRRRVPSQRHPLAPLHHPRLADPRGHLRSASSRTWRSCGGRSTRSSQAGAAPQTTWWAHASGRPTPPRASDCSRSWQASSPSSVVPRRSIPSGSTDRSRHPPVSTAAQPDWYMGWIKGALRLMPPALVRVGPYTVSELFWPTVLLPTGSPSGCSTCGRSWSARPPVTTPSTTCSTDRANVPCARRSGWWSSPSTRDAAARGGQDIWAQELDLSLPTVLWALADHGRCRTGPRRAVHVEALPRPLRRRPHGPAISRSEPSHRWHPPIRAVEHAPAPTPEPASEPTSSTPHPLRRTDHRRAHNRGPGGARAARSSSPSTPGRRTIRIDGNSTKGALTCR